MKPQPTTCESLGYPPHARLLIVNADDFGMCYTANEATIYALSEGLASSCTLMVPCPWARHGMELLRAHPEIPFGVHLTAVSEHALYRWGPVTGRHAAPSLVDEAGYFFSEERIPELIARADVKELEGEFRAQIEAVLAAGLQPTHLDSHCDVHARREDILEMTLALAREYGLAMRASTEGVIQLLRKRGYPCHDHPVLDSYVVDTAGKAEAYRRMLRELPPGLSEWAVHPGADTNELRAITSEWHVRHADSLFLTSSEARAVIAEEGIGIVDYRLLQAAWRRVERSLAG